MTQCQQLTFYKELCCGLQGSNGCRIQHRSATFLPAKPGYPEPLLFPETADIPFPRQSASSACGMPGRYLGSARIHQGDQVCHWPGAHDHVPYVLQYLHLLVDWVPHQVARTPTHASATEHESGVQKQCLPPVQRYHLYQW